MKVILVSFGSRCMTEEMRNLEERLIALSPVETETAYLSHISEGKELEEIIEKEKDTAIMPLLIQKGHEYRKLLSFSRPTGEPLLSSFSDTERIAVLLNNLLERGNGRKHILVAHGCEGERIREYDAINARLRDDIRIVTLKGEGKFTPEAAGNAEKIIIHPFLLTIGHHANHDIKEELIPAVQGTGAHVVYQNESILSLSDEFALIFEEHFMALLEKLDLLRTIGSK